MKKTLTTFGLLLTTLMFGQTSEIELNYANGGYIELKKMGIEPKEGYTIKKTGLKIKESRPKGDGPYLVHTLVRDEDNSVAAVMLAKDGQKPIFVVMDPKTRTEEQYVKQTSFMAYAIDAEDALVELLQEIYWPE